MTVDHFNIRRDEKIRLGFKCVQPCQVKLLTGEFVTVVAYQYQDKLDTDSEAERRLYYLSHEDGKKDSLPNELELIEIIGQEAFNALT